MGIRGKDQLEVIAIEMIQIEAQTQTKTKNKLQTLTEPQRPVEQHKKKKKPSIYVIGVAGGKRWEVQKKYLRK